MPGMMRVAIAVETDADGDIHPAVYVRRDGEVEEHLLRSTPTHDYLGAEHRQELVVQHVADHARVDREGERQERGREQAGAGERH